MANIKSAIKRNRQNEKNRSRNRDAISRMRSFIKKVLEAVEAGDVDLAKKSLHDATSVISRVAQKGMIHQKQASRRVKRLNKRVKTLAQAKA
ncbi:MAG: 30S ribosomal protein S20 [Magnetococcales bacterium]|nr:30S ribosomal protein S20 [Magnetococcales bacterium]